MKTRTAWLIQAGILLSCLAWIFVGPEAGSVVMAMAVITGGRATAGTGQGIDSNSRVIDMSDTIHLLDPNLAPLTAITMKLRKAHAINPKVEWLEDDYLPTSDTVNGTSVTGSAGVIVDNIGYFRVGDILKTLDDGDVHLVTGVNTASSILTITRSIGATADAQMDDGATLLIIGNANAEFATGRTLKTTSKTPQYNWTEIFRWPFGSSGTLMASELYGGDDHTYQSRKAGLEHRIQIERAYLFGERYEGTGGTAAIRACDGVIARIATNITTQTQMTKVLFETFLRTGFRYGPAAKMFFASRPIVSYLNLIAAASIETIPTTESFPLALTEYTSGHGKCYIVTHNLLEGAGGNNTAYSGWGLLLDLDSIFHRYLNGRDTHIKTHIEANDEDGRKDEYKSECCPMIIQEKNHSIWRGATGYA